MFLLNLITFVLLISFHSTTNSKDSNELTLHNTIKEIVLEVPKIDINEKKQKSKKKTKTKNDDSDYLESKSALTLDC